MITCMFVAGFLYAVDDNGNRAVQAVAVHKIGRSVVVESGIGAANFAYPRTEDFQRFIDMDAGEWLQWCEQDAIARAEREND